VLARLASEPLQRFERAVDRQGACTLRDSVNAVISTQRRLLGEFEHTLLVTVIDSGSLRNQE